jgi:hypothetical protein
MLKFVQIFVIGKFKLCDPVTILWDYKVVIKTSSLRLQAFWLKYDLEGLN